jgi:GNAT superfamily N-acetyltransferase
MSHEIRPATIEDVPAMKRIRDGVRENRLLTISIGEPAYVHGITVEGRAWVAVEDGAVVGFVCGRIVQRDIWALFLDERYEGRGIGTALMDVVEAWMFERGIDRIELTTEPGTRAERLYRKRGWSCEGLTASGELHFTLTRQASR